jgi:hypothetical protein
VKESLETPTYHRLATSPSFMCSRRRPRDCSGRGPASHRAGRCPPHGGRHPPTPALRRQPPGSRPGTRRTHR